jgi:tRNA(His) 5'-end guanylyltransferase
MRLDGRAFHTLTRQLKKPFSPAFMVIMIESAMEVCREIQGCELAYVQSDEVSIVFSDCSSQDTQGWFDYKLAKILSIASALMSTHFTAKYQVWAQTSQVGVFDARAFNVPAKDVPNYFVWRIKDWLRNSLSMFARAHFSHKELMNKHAGQVHEMLHEKGLNWATDLNDMCKNGTWIYKDKDTGWKAEHFPIQTYDEVNTLWQKQKTLSS